MSPSGRSAPPVLASDGRRGPDPAPKAPEPREGTIEGRVWRDLTEREGRTLSEVSAAMSADLSKPQVRAALRKLQTRGLAECRTVKDRHGDVYHYWHKRGADGA